MRDLGVKAVHGIVKLFGKLPLGFHYGVANVVAWLAKDVVKYRYDVVMTNLARSFPELKYDELKLIAKDFYRHFADIFAEAVWFSASSYKRLIDSKICVSSNPQLLNDYFTSTPSVTVLFSHCGNWEIIGGILAYLGSEGCNVIPQEKDVKVVYKKLHNRFSNEFFKMNRISPLGKDGWQCEVETDDVLRYSLKRKDLPTVYVYIADQFPYQTWYNVGDFLHQQTWGMLGSVKVAHKLGHSVLYMRMKALERGKYELSFEPICRDASKVKPEIMMRKYFDLLQEDIKEQPYNWLWTHKRWK